MTDESKRTDDTRENEGMSNQNLSQQQFPWHLFAKGHDGESVSINGPTGPTPNGGYNEETTRHFEKISHAMEFAKGHQHGHGFNGSDNWDVPDTPIAEYGLRREGDTSTYRVEPGTGREIGQY